MARAQDVAAYILTKQGPMSAMKLQKLVYYSQAWHLVWEDRPLFRAKVEARANGPVVRSLYEQHRGQFTLRAGDIDGDPRALDQDERSSVDAVLHYYGDKSAHWLSELTHREPPWSEARGGLAPDQRGASEITRAAMAEYYGSLIEA